MENSKEKTLETMIQDQKDYITNLEAFKANRKGYVINLNDLMFHSGDSQPCTLFFAKVYEFENDALRDNNRYKWRNGNNDILKPIVESVEVICDRRIESANDVIGRIELARLNPTS